MRRFIVVVLVSALVVLTPCSVASAGPRGITRDGGGVTAQDSTVVKRKATSSQRSTSRPTERGLGRCASSRTEGRARQLSPEERTKISNAAARRQQARIRAAIASYTARLNSANACLQAGSGAGRCRLPAAPELGVQVATATLLPGQTQDTAADPNTPPPVVLTPQQVAYIAFARLKLTAPTPGVGPPPSINEWKMAAVGYPLWLWGEGDIDPAPVSDSVGGLSVSLEAHVSKIVFDMGDGSKVTCRGAGQKWTRSVLPGQKSPVCGHVYAKPSLPRGPYKITATTHWAVAWTVTGQRGVIPFVQVASNALPVGELQVLVR